MDRLSWYINRGRNSQKRRKLIRPYTKVTEAQVREIRRRHANGENPLQISKDYDLSFQHVYRICRRAQWADLAD